MAFILIVIGTFGAVTKELIIRGREDVKGWVEIIQPTALLRSARILRSVLEAWGHLLSLKPQWKPSVFADMKNS